MCRRRNSVSHRAVISFCAVDSPAKLTHIRNANQLVKSSVTANCGAVQCFVGQASCSLGMEERPATKRWRAICELVGWSVRRRSLTRFDRLEDHGSGLLNYGQRIGQSGRVAAVKLHVIGGGCIHVESDAGTNYECDRFGLGLAHSVRRLLAPLPAMEHLVSAFMGESRQLLGR